MSSWFTKLKNILTGKDLNWDGKVDIHDDMIEAKNKVEKEHADKESKRRVQNR
tara:strand:- start:4 stop:162 length:159 start_codon:yes stop_codon:yes gene_type:complete